MADLNSTSLSRSGSMRNRPLIQPMGPRTRSRASFRESRSPPAPALDPITTSEPVQPMLPSPSSSRPNSKGILPVITEDSPTQPAPPYEEATPRPADTNIAFKAVPTLPKLVSPPTLNFESTPVPWKGLPMEAAVWKFDSRELQDIVSRAIRSSSRESFIRLLSLDLLDKTLPNELERLETLRGTSQSRYRFLVHRRTMLMQALNSTSGSSNHGDSSIVGKLTVQLSETVAECDKLVEDLMRLSDQIVQVTKLLEAHWAGALAIALRKLNASYGRRTAELIQAREKNEQLQAELEEAWKQAESMAKEIDDIDDAILTEYQDEPIIERAEVIPVSKSPSSPGLSLRPISPKILTVEPMASSSTPLQTLPSSTIRDTAPEDVPDTVSVRSNHSTKSHKSTRSINRADSSRVSLVSAARKRSLRASQGSLRFSYRNHGRKQSSQKLPQDPPIPDFPFQFSSSLPSPAGTRASSTLLTFNGGNDNSLDHYARQARRRRTSLESIPPPPPSSFRGPATRDDIYIRPQSSSSEIQVVPRTPPKPDLVPLPLEGEDNEVHEMRLAPQRHPSVLGKKTAQPTQPSRDIPSIWMQADSPKSPSERIASLVRQNSISNPYTKLRTLTKRYSLPFPMFSTKITPATPLVHRRSG